MKKNIRILLLLVLIIGMIATGCGDAKESSTEPSTTLTEETTVDMETETNSDVESESEESETVEDTTDGNKEPENTESETTESNEPESEAPEPQPEAKPEPQPEPEKPAPSYTYRECVKMMFATKETGLYHMPSTEGYLNQMVQPGDPLPVVARCEENGWYKVRYMGDYSFVCGDDVTDVRPLKYAAGGEEGWESLTEETKNGKVWQTGTYRVNGFEVRAKDNKGYVDRMIRLAKEGLYQPVWRELDGKYWSAQVEMLIELPEGGSVTQESLYWDWLADYIAAQGIEPSLTRSSGSTSIYRLASDASGKEIFCVCCCIDREE